MLERRGQNERPHRPQPPQQSPESEDQGGQQTSMTSSFIVRCFLAGSFLATVWAATAFGLLPTWDTVWPVVACWLPVEVAWAIYIRVRACVRVCVPLKLREVRVQRRCTGVRAQASVGCGSVAASATLLHTFSCTPSIRCASFLASPSSAPRTQASLWSRPRSSARWTT